MHPEETHTYLGHTSWIRGRSGGELLPQPRCRIVVLHGWWPCKFVVMRGETPEEGEQPPAAKERLEWIFFCVTRNTLYVVALATFDLATARAGASRGVGKRRR